MNSAAEEEVCGSVNMNADKHVQFEVCLSHAETEAATKSTADTYYNVKQLGREICIITSNEQMRFKLEMPIHLFEFESW
jgi:hypothetical protein